MIAVDTNVLVYAHREETDFHGDASARLVEMAEGDVPWALPIFCVGEFLRVVTHPRVFDPPSTPGDALDFVQGLLASPSCVIAYPETGFLTRLDGVVRGSNTRGNLVFDAQIAALCMEQGIDAILTNDRDFERFKPLRVSYLASPSRPERAGS